MESNDNYHIIFKCQKNSLILHWGIGSKAREWICPSEDIIETVKNTTKFNEKAAQSIFLENIDIFLNKKYKFLNFVFYDSSNVNNLNIRINGIIMIIRILLSN